MDLSRLSGLSFDISTLPGTRRLADGTTRIDAKDVLLAINGTTGLDFIGACKHLDKVRAEEEQKAEAQVEGMREAGDVFSSTVTLEDGSLFGRRMALEELFQLFVGRVKEENGEKLGRVSINVMGQAGDLLRPFRP